MRCSGRGKRLESARISALEGGLLPGRCCLGSAGLGSRGAGERRDVRHRFPPATRAGRPGLAAAQLAEGTPGGGTPA